VQTGQSTIFGTLTNTSNIQATATYTVTPVLLNGCTNSATFTAVVTVNPRPAITNMTATSCEGVLFQVSPVQTTNGTVPAGTVYSWDVPSFNSSLTGGQSGTWQTHLSGNFQNLSNSIQTVTYQVVPRNSSALGSCVGATFTINVGILPNAAITPFALTQCSGLFFSYSPAHDTNGVIPANTTYTWVTPTGQNLIGLTNQPTAVNGIFGTLSNTSNALRTATYTVTPSSPGSCAGTAFTVTVNINPIVSIAGITRVVCSEGSINFSPTSSNGIVPANTNYELVSATGSSAAVTWTAFSGISATIAGTFSNTSNTAQSVTFTVRPILANGCTNSNNFTVVITVNPKPAVTNMTAISCEGTTFQVSPVVGNPGVNGLVPAGTLYTWSVPTYTASLSGGVSQSSPQAFLSGSLQNASNIIQTATYLVVPQNSSALGSCAGATFTVNVGILPNAAVNNPLSQTVCSGVSFNIVPTHQADGTIPDNTTYTWTQLPSGIGITGGITATNASVISGTLISSNSIARTATFSVSPTSPGGCPGGNYGESICLCECHDQNIL
jgi:hypothetical protein